MKLGSFRLVGLLCAVSLLPPIVSAQGISLSVFRGLSKDTRSKTENVWKLGYNVGAHAFISLPVLTIGGRLSYHSWGADGAAWLKEIDPNTNYTVKSEEGKQTVVEIVPSLRFALLNPPVGLRIDLQVGVGMFLISTPEVRVTGAFDTGTTSGEATYILSSESLTGFGPQIGFPVSLLGMVEIIPVYTAYSAKGDWYNHWALDTGFKFGL